MISYPHERGSEYRKYLLWLEILKSFEPIHGEIIAQQTFARITT